MSNKDGLSEMCDVQCQAKLEGFFSSDAIKMYGVEVSLHAFINPGTRWRWMDSFSSTYPGRKRIRYHWIGECLEQGETLQLEVEREICAGLKI
jgi:hypothetical protein